MTFIGVGVIIKFILQIPCMMIVKGLGPLLATGLAMMVVNYLILHSFNMEFGLHFNEMAHATNQILGFSIIMFVVVKIVMLLIGMIVSPYGRYTAFFSLIPGVLVGVIVFVYLALRFRLADNLLGPRMEALRIRLHIK